MELVFPNIAAMAVYDDSLLDDGSPCKVATLLADWEIRRSSTDAPDGITIVPTNSGVGNWCRGHSDSSYWRARKQWWITDVTGNDEALGDAANPLATWDELRRRRGPQLPPTGLVEVTLDGPGGVFSQDFVVDFVTERGPVVGVNALWVKGTRTLLYSGSVTARTVWNAAAGTVTTITDAAIPASWTASGLVRRLLVMTSGPNAGAAAYVAFDRGAKTAEMAQLYSDSIGWGGFEPAVGETFDVYSVTELTGAVSITTGIARLWLTELRLHPLMVQPDNEDIEIVASSVYFGLVHLDTPHFESHGAIVDFFGCLLSGAGVQDLYSGRYRLGWTSLVDDCLAVHSGAEILVDENSIVRDGELSAGPGGGTITLDPTGGELAVFGCTAAPALRALTGGVLDVGAAIFGTGNTFDHIMTVQSGGTVKWSSIAPPTATGSTVSNMSVGGTQLTWAAGFAGYVNLTNLAASEVAAE
jgi:hypothetical protein